MGRKLFHTLFFITFFIQQLGAQWTQAKLKIRLSDILVPEKYELNIYTDVTKVDPQYRGDVTITINCGAATNEIIINENFLEIDSIQVRPMDKEEEDNISVIDRKSSMTSDQIKLILNKKLVKNNRYELKLTYHKSSYLHKQEGYLFRLYEEPRSLPNIYYLAYTQMREVEARRVIPCFDQIGMKSKFSIRLAHPAGIKSFSNAKQIGDSEPIDEPKGWVVDKFEDIDSMSTFSLALVVADYDSIGPAEIPADVTDIEIKVWAEKKEVLQKLEVVLDITTRCYVFFSNYFKTSYKLGKLDMIVVHNTYIDVQDSYGLIILRQTDLLNVFDESNTNLAHKYSIVSKICNAISRQWIGHSVTMTAWNETWLHFGLNSFLQKLCISDLQLFLHWRSFDEHLLVESFFILLRTEERGDYNPIVSLGSGSFFTAYSNSPQTYAKVHHVIRMLSFILDSEKDVFRKSLENYVKKFEAGNTDVDKTWKIFTKTVNDEDSSLLPDNITVQMIMDSWLAQKGHPLINVNIQNKSDNEIIYAITQEPFTISDPVESKTDQAQKPCWIIPLSFTTKEKMEFQEVKVQEWLKCDGKPVIIKNFNVKEWILFNMKLNVPCRVNYEYPIWLSIQKSLQNPEEFARLDLLTRIRLTSDMFALAKAEKLSYSFLFTTIEHLLEQERNYDCWKVAISELNRIRLRWIGTELHKFFLQYVRNILRPILKEKILKKTTLTLDQFLKSPPKNAAFEILIFMAACIFEALECVQLTHKLQREWKENIFGENSQLIPVDLRESVFCLAMKNADMMERDFLFDMYKKTKIQNLKNSILTALGCSNKNEILTKYLKWGMNLKISEISPELSLKVFGALCSNAQAFPIIMKFFKDELEQFDELLYKRRENITIEHFLVKAIDASRDRKAYEELIKMLPTNGGENRDAKKLVEESKFTAERNIKWLEMKEEDMIKYFTN